MENVVIQPGGKPTIWKFFAVVMNEGDEVLYPNPGYPIYESQIQFQGGVPVPYGYDETDTGFVIDIEKIARINHGKNYSAGLQQLPESYLRCIKSGRGGSAGRISLGA